MSSLWHHGAKVKKKKKADASLRAYAYPKLVSTSPVNASYNNLIYFKYIVLFPVEGIIGLEFHPVYVLFHIFSVLS